MTFKTKREVVGLIPAGGLATRIAPLPCSKELYPVGFYETEDGQQLRPKVACHYLLEKMRLSGVKNVFIVLRKGKWDIPTYLGDGTILRLNLAYLIMRLPYGTPYTLDQAYPFVKDAMVVCGFSDIIFQPDNAFVQLLDHQAASNADVLLGLFPATQPHKMDMVDVDKNGRVQSIVIKPRKTNLTYTWFIAAWTPSFSRFMHEYLLDHQNVNQRNSNRENKSEELYVGDVFQAAIETGMIVESVLFQNTDYIDIGTPEDLVKAIRSFG